MTNIKKEMAFYGKEITEDNLQHCTQITTIMHEFGDEIEVSHSPDSTFESTPAFSTTLLDVTSIANLDHAIFNDDNQLLIQTDTEEHLVRSDNIDYDVDGLVSSFLDEEG